MRTKKYLGIVLIVSAILLGIFVIKWGCRGFPYTAEKIDYQMYGVWVNPHSTGEKEVEFSVKGRVLKTKDGAYLDVDFAMPEDFPVRLEGYNYDNGFKDVFYVMDIDQLPGYPYYWGPLMFVYGNEKNSPVGLNIALSTDMGYFILMFEEDPERCLVASTDPETDPQEILSYFDKFIQRHSYKP
jgi:hypothetical protein